MALLELLTNPQARIVYVCSKDKFVELRFSRIMRQLERNELILEDFGDVRPPKGGSGMWNRHALCPISGAELLGESISGGVRGHRASLIIIDDPEHDPKAGTDQEQVVEGFEQTLFNVILPMLEGDNACLFWIGTIISRRCFLYNVCRGADPRTVAWNRRIYAALENGQPIWPEKWGTKKLEEKRLEIGDSAFSAEYLNDPRSDVDCILKINPETCEYNLHNPDADTSSLDENPLESPVVLSWNNRIRMADSSVVQEPQERTAAEHFKSMHRVITVDYAYSVTASSDFSAIHVLGADRHNQCWSLDLWHGKARSEELVRRIWEMALKWRVRVVGVEYTTIREEFFSQVRDMGDEIAQRYGWAPQCVLIKYPYGVQKGDRIASALEWRFRRGLIKLPKWRSTIMPYRELYTQIRDFTPDLKLLPKDDAIDTLAMYQQIVKGPSVGKEEDVAKPGLMELLESGEKYLPGGIPIALAFDPQQLPPSVLAMLEESCDNTNRRRTWDNSAL